MCVEMLQMFTFFKLMIRTLAISQFLMLVALTLQDTNYLCQWHVKSLLSFGKERGGKKEEENV